MDSHTCIITHLMKISFDIYIYILEVDCCPIFNKSMLLHKHHIMKMEFEQRWSTSAPISIQWTTTADIKLWNRLRHTDENPCPGEELAYNVAGSYKCQILFIGLYLTSVIFFIQDQMTNTRTKQTGSKLFIKRYNWIRCF
jgi:hypothetical protein